MKSIIIFCGTVFVLITFLLIPSFSQVQKNSSADRPVVDNPGLGHSDAAPGNGNPPRGPRSHQPDIPIDGGASFLAAAGLAYGLKKYRDHRKNPAA